jgi:hypothetical protein
MGSFTLSQYDSIDEFAVLRNSSFTSDGKSVCKSFVKLKNISNQVTSYGIANLAYNLGRATFVFERDCHYTTATAQNKI